MEPAPIPSVTTPTQCVSSRAFTLIEMMVVLAIIAIISVITLTGQSTFNQTLILKDTSYALEYSIRQAQTFGLSNTKVGTVSNLGYGIDFNAGTPDRYTFFADSDRTNGIPTYCPVGITGQPDAKPGNCRYSNPNEVISTTKFTRGFTISRFCAKDTNGARYCSDDTGGPFLQVLDIAFARPSTQAIMTGSTNIALIPSQIACSEIYVKAPTGGVTNTIRVSQFGEISINQTCP